MCNINPSILVAKFIIAILLGNVFVIAFTINIGFIVFLTDEYDCITDNEDKAYSYVVSISR